MLDRPRFRLIEQDICRSLDLAEPVDRIFNLACAASPPRYQADPIHTTRTCVIGTLNLLELAARNNARFLQASTSEVYGDPEQHRDGREGTVDEEADQRRETEWGGPDRPDPLSRLARSIPRLVAG